ncbi:MAG: hypothetical protein LV481_04510 [Methylacidiphilales bacterium]|nr:hypothetical protein [Candidatus Methylacidiphilales bacterium]
MKLLILLATICLLTFPMAARADRNPDFDDDAKPILRLQPGLLEYVETHFKVKDTGTAKYPGTDDRAPQPPYMFQAKPRGEPGPYHLMLLIQPGPANHILNVVDMNRVHLDRPFQTAPTPAPTVAHQPTPQPTIPSAPTNQPAESAQTPAPSQTPTADTPSGPIQASPGNQSPSTAPSLEPPPDPTPTNH